MKNILLLIILTFTTSLFAQTGIVEGRVYDKTTNEGLAFAAVYYEVKAQKKRFKLFRKRKLLKESVHTDRNGYYQLKNVPVGKRNIIIQYLGYHDLTIENVIVKENETTTINASLKENGVIMCDCGCGKHVAEKVVLKH